MNLYIKKHRLNITLIIFALAFVFLVFLCYLFPYSGDDWAWGGSLGIERLNNLFKNYNGRYLGNFFVLALTRSNILKTIVMSITLFGISIFSYLIVGKNRLESFIIFFFSLLATPRLIFRQAVVWTSGFSNYAVPVIFLFSYLYMIRNVAEHERLFYKKRYTLYAVSLGFIGALFIEHLTLYQVLIGIFIIGYSFLVYKKTYAVHVGFLAGSLSGAILMFSNGAYRNIAQDSDSYREIPLSLADMVENAREAFVNVVCKHGMFGNITLNILLMVFISFLVINFISEEKKHSFLKRTLIQLSAAICITYPLYSLLTIIYNGWQILDDNTATFEAYYATAAFLSLVLLTYLCISDKVRKRRMIFELLSIPVLCFPLLFVHPIGARCFFITYVFFSLYFAELVVYLISKKNNRVVCSYILKVFLLFCFCFSIYYINIFTKIAKDDKKRTEYIFEQIEEGKETVLVPNLIYNGYLWTSLPEKGTVWEWRYKDFHCIDQNIIFENISNKKWKSTK